MIEELIKADCIQYGKFTLKNGNLSKYYFNLKNLIAHPNLIKIIGDNLIKKMNKCDIICAVPYGGMPIAGYMSTKYDIPMIFTRSSQKSYGMCNQIEGTYKTGYKCVIIDDVMTSGASVQEAVDILTTNGINVIQVLVVIDRQQNSKCNIKNINYLYTKTDVIRYILKDIMFTKKSKVCFSADMTNPVDIISMLEKIGTYIVICKLHTDIIHFNSDLTYEIFVEQMLDLSTKYNFLIMEDRKFNDISSIVEKQYMKYQNWCDLVTVHGIINEEVIKKLSGILLVANMSNNNFDVTQSVLSMAQNNKDRVIGFITQYKIKDDSFISMTPGINNLYSTDGKDQEYRKINEIDADIYIVGRGIYNSKDPEVTIKNYLI